MKRFDYYSGEDLKFPRSPKKPGLKGNPTSADVRRYADKLEEYEIEFEKYSKLKKEYYEILNARTVEFRNDLHSKYCPELSDAAFSVIFNKAWEDGHSSGHYRVDELVDELTDFVLEIMEKMK